MKNTENAPEQPWIELITVNLEEINIKTDSITLPTRYQNEYRYKVINYLD